MWSLPVLLFVSGALCDGFAASPLTVDDDVPQPLIYHEVPQPMMDDEVPQPLIDDDIIPPPLKKVPSHWTLVSYADGTPISGLAESRHKQNQKLIKNGENAVNGNQPYMVSLQAEYEGKLYHICGGSLINDKKVLTAAHCLDDWGTHPHKAALGYYQLSLGTGNVGSQLISVSKAVKSPDYRGHWKSLPGDIAVLTLESSAQFTTTVNKTSISAGLPQHFVGRDVSLTGWGKTNTGQHSDILQYADLKVIDKATCLTYWPDRIRNQHVCTRNPPISPCKGDSGGPLVYLGNVMGVVSWGNNGCDPQYPTMYASPAYFKNFLYANWW